MDIAVQQTSDYTDSHWRNGTPSDCLLHLLFGGFSPRSKKPRAFFWFFTELRETQPGSWRKPKPAARMESGKCLAAHAHPGFHPGYDKSSRHPADRRRGSFCRVGTLRLAHSANQAARGAAFID